MASFLCQGFRIPFRTKLEKGEVKQEPSSLREVWQCDLCAARMWVHWHLAPTNPGHSPPDHFPHHPDLRTQRVRAKRKGGREGPSPLASCPSYEATGLWSEDWGGRGYSKDHLIPRRAFPIQARGWQLHSFSASRWTLHASLLRLHTAPCWTPPCAEPD